MDGYDVYGVCEGNGASGWVYARIMSVSAHPDHLHSPEHQLTAEAKGLLPDLLNLMGPARWLQVRES